MLCVPRVRRWPADKNLDGAGKSETTSRRQTILVRWWWFLFFCLSVVVVFVAVYRLTFIKIEKTRRLCFDFDVFWLILCDVWCQCACGIFAVAPSFLLATTKAANQPDTIVQHTHTGNTSGNFCLRCCCCCLLYFSNSDGFDLASKRNHFSTESVCRRELKKKAPFRRYVAEYSVQFSQFSGTANWPVTFNCWTHFFSGCFIIYSYYFFFFFVLFVSTRAAGQSQFSAPPHSPISLSLSLSRSHSYSPSMLSLVSPAVVCLYPLTLHLCMSVYSLPPLLLARSLPQYHAFAHGPSMCLYVCV